MSYNSSLPVDNTADIRENFRALKEDKIVAAATAVTAESADKLTTARNISLTGDATGSVAFDGSADVSIAVDVVSADVSASCTGNAATATKLETAREINGVAFDGSSDITITVDTVGGYTPNNLMPLGAIVMWSGNITAIPEKWALCNGSNGTPDLCDKFVLGAGNSYAVGATGGEAAHTLTVEEMPNHKHSYRLDYEYVSGGNNMVADESGAGLPGGAYPTQYTDATGGNSAHNNMPPYYALAYIMRIA